MGISITNNSGYTFAEIKPPVILAGGFLWFSNISMKDKAMETIKEFLDSKIYLDVIKELGSNNFNKDLQSIEIQELRNRLNQRQFLLEGFNCKLYSEKELVQFFKQMIEYNHKEIVLWCKAFWQYSDKTWEEYPDGEFPKGEELDREDKSTILEIGKYSITSIASYMIEFDILKNYPDILEDYYKRLHIPGAVKYGREIKGLYKSLFC